MSDRQRITFTCDLAPSRSRTVVDKARGLLVRGVAATDLVVTPEHSPAPAEAIPVMLTADHLHVLLDHLQETLRPAVEATQPWASYDSPEDPAQDPKTTAQGWTALAADLRERLMFALGHA